MATDMVTLPVTNKGCWLFGIGFTIALVMMGGFREIRGTGLTLIIAGSLSLAFTGFAGLL